MKKNMTEYIIKELNYIYYILRPYQRIFLFLPSPSMFHYWHSLLPILQGKSMYRGPTKCAASANTYTWCCHRRLHQNKPSREYQVNNQIDNLLRQLLLCVSELMPQFAFKDGKIYQYSIRKS